jgi:hypothetical protein
VQLLKDSPANQEITTDAKPEVSVNENTLSWYDVPDDIKTLLLLAAENWENTSESEKYINQAVAKTEGNLDVLIAAYRYFFYKNNNSIALKMALKVVDKIRRTEKLPDDWEQVKPILLSRKEEPQIRLYLNAYSACGFVLARLGEIDKAKEVSSRVKEVDDKNEFGAAILLDILTRPAEEDE